MRALVTNNNPASVWRVVIRSLLGRCPKCGQGNLFAGYLKQVEQCAVCGEVLGHIRADDGPAWLTILLMGHIFAIFLLGFSPKVSWPNWAIMAVIMPATLALTLVILPRAKGFFIGMIWRSGCAGSEK